MELCNDTEVPSQTHRYSIPQLIDVGCKTIIAVSISIFTIEAIQGQLHAHTHTLTDLFILFLNSLLTPTTPILT